MRITTIPALDIRSRQCSNSDDYPLVLLTATDYSLLHLHTPYRAAHWSHDGEGIAESRSNLGAVFVGLFVKAGLASHIC